MKKDELKIIMAKEAFDDVEVEIEVSTYSIEKFDKNGKATGKAELDDSEAGYFSSSWDEFADEIVDYIKETLSEYNFTEEVSLREYIMGDDTMIFENYVYEMPNGTLRACTEKQALEMIEENKTVELSRIAISMYLNKVSMRESLKDLQLAIWK